MNANHEIRHCAFCLKEIHGLLIKKCGSCKKRSYCSKECQTADWSVTGSGQRHKNWCGRYDYGEEDVDWEVIPVENKGFGVVAKRLLPAGYRILLEPVFTNPHDHPGINDLEPRGASLEAKFKLNAFGGHEERDDGRNILGLRSSRINHSCRPNAGISYDDVARVRIVIAQQDIQKGEEICIMYSFFGCYNSITPKQEPSEGESPEDQEFANIQRSLKKNWGITCPPDCFCKNPHSKKLVMEGRRLFEKMQSLANEGRIDEALKAGDDLLKIDAELNFSWNQRGDIYTELFEIAIKAGKRERALQYVEYNYKICQILYPFSDATQLCKVLLNL